jgi:hypothetical protein
MSVNILEANLNSEFDGQIVPSKGSLPRSINPDQVPFEFSGTYQIDAFFPSEIVELGAPYILREIRGISMRVSPIRVNPVQGVIRVYDRIVFKVYADGTDTQNVLASAPSRVSDAFIGLYGNHFLNYTSSIWSLGVLIDNSWMLVISYPGFMEAMEPFSIYIRPKRG